MAEPTLDTYPIHAAFIHDKVEEESDDIYIMDLAYSLKKYSHDISIYTSSYREGIYARNYNQDLHICGRWIPNSIFGFFEKSLSIFKAAWMSFSFILFPPTPKPNVVILDINPIALPILNYFRKYKIIYIQNFKEIRSYDYSSRMPFPPVSTKKRLLKYADAIILQSNGLLNLFRYIYPEVTIDPFVLMPSFESGPWWKDPIDIRMMIPDLPKQYILFVVFGEFQPKTNFKLALHTMEHLFAAADDEMKRKIHLVFAGEYKQDCLSHKLYYDDLINRIKGKTYASQVTFLKDPPVICQKTLIAKCTAVIHTSRQDLFPSPILGAMAMGKPVIAVNSGFAAEVVMNRLTGVLIEPDPFKFAKVMGKLANNKTVQYFISEMSRDYYRSHYSTTVLGLKMTKLINNLYGINK